MNPGVAKLLRVPDDALPVFLVHVLPAGVLAAMPAAIQVNFVQPRAGRKLSGRESLRLARAILLSSGCAVILAALAVRELGTKHSIILILNIVIYPFASVLAGGIAGFLATTAVPLARLLIPPGPDWAFLQQLERVSDFYYGFLGMAATLAAGYAASLLGPPPPRDKIEGRTRRLLPAFHEAALPVEVR